jgi:hypothetical protein
LPTWLSLDASQNKCISDNPPPSNGAIIDSAGAYHSEYQDYMLGLIVNSTLSLKDTSILKIYIDNRSYSFFQSKGIADGGITGIFSPFGYPDSLKINPSKYSSQGASIMLQFQTLVNNYNPLNDASFYNALNSLKQSALMLQGNRQLSVGIPVSVAINSFKYWEANYSKWNSLLTSHMQQYQGFNALQKTKIGLGQIGAADVAGTISVALDGAALGVGGALAGGVLGSATSSLFNLGGQVIGHFFSWW